MLPLSCISLNTVLEVSAITIRQDKLIQGKTVKRKGNYIPICRWDCLTKKPQTNNNIDKYQYTQ